MRAAQRPTPWKAIRNSALIFGLLSGCGPLAARSPADIFTSPTPALTETVVPTETIYPTETQTSTPEPTETPEPSPTPEPILGGEGVGVQYNYYDGKSVSNIPPPEITSHLIPTTPEQWKENMNLTDSTGKPLAWGKPTFVIELLGYLGGDGVYPVIPFLVRDIVQYETYDLYNAPLYFAILETPARGGSNFLIMELIDYSYGASNYTYFEYPATGLPSDWVDQKVTSGQMMPYIVKIGGFNDKKLLAFFQKHLGSVVLVGLPDTPAPVGTIPEFEQLVADFSEAVLLPKGFRNEHGTTQPEFYIPHAGQ